MSLRNAASIALPALLLVVLHVSGRDPRWLGRPSFIKGKPRRATLAIALSAILTIAIIHAIGLTAP